MNEQETETKTNTTTPTPKPFKKRVTDFIKRGLSNIDRNMKNNPVGTSINVTSSH